MSRLVAALIGSLLLAACGGDGEPQEPGAVGTAVSGQAGAGASAPPSSPEPPFIGEIVWATSLQPETGEPVERATRIEPNASTIYAAVQVAHLPPGAELTASWTYNDEPLEAVQGERSIATPVWSSEPAWVEFHLSRDGDQPWPEGTYAITIGLNGQAIRSGTIEVGAGG